MIAKLSKCDWREQIKKFYSQLSNEQFLEKSSQLSKQLSTLMSEVNGDWGVYSPIPCEPDWRVEVEHKPYGYPDFVDGHMVFKLCSDQELVVSKSFGVELKTPLRDLPIFEPQAILVPGLAFTKKGDRLGRGKGFYDRYLESFSGLKVGICFSEQVTDNLPTEVHDQKVDLVLTDGGLIRCSDNLGE